MFLDVRGQKTYAATGGKTYDPNLPTVMFVHGSGLDHRSWALQTRWFAYNGYSVLAPDLPGHSLSRESRWKPSKRWARGWRIFCAPRAPKKPTRSAIRRDFSMYSSSPTWRRSC